MDAILCGGIRGHHRFLYQAGYDITWLVATDNQFPEDLKSDAKRRLVYSPGDRIEIPYDIAMKLHEYVGFRKVFAFHDDSQELAIRIADSIGCGFPFSIDVLHNTRVKPLMRRHLAGAGLASCWYSVAANESELRHVAKSCKLAKVIIKPVDGTLSRNIVALVDPPSVTSKWIRDRINSFPVLVEEFLEGKEYSVESFSAHGVHYIAGVTEKFKDDRSFVETGHIFPADIDESIYKSITDYVIRVLTALGVSNSAAHTEIILTASGPRIIETHTRVGGDSIPTMVKHVTGIDLYELGACIQIDSRWNGAESVFAQRTAAGYCGIQYVLPPAANKRIKEVVGLDRAKAMPGILDVNAEYTRGDRTRHLTDSLARMAYVRAAAPSRSALVGTLKSATDCIRYEYEEDEDESDLN